MELRKKRQIEGSIEEDRLVDSKDKQTKVTNWKQFKVDVVSWCQMLSVRARVMCAGKDSGNVRKEQQVVLMTARTAKAGSNDSREQSS